MNRTRTYTLTASLCLIAAAGCRGEPENTPPADMASSQDLSISSSDDLATEPDLADVDLAPPPPPTEFMVARIGDGSVVVSGTSAPVFVERHKVSDGSIVGTPIALPTTVTGTSKRLTLTTSSNAEGNLSLSDDGHYLIIAGYDAAPGTAAVIATATAADRVIGRIDQAGTVNTTTSAAFLGNQNIRGAGSTNGTDLWAAGNGGIFYTTLGATTVPGTIISGNWRWLDFIGGQLYATSGAGTTRGVNTIGSGAPKTTATTTLLPGFAVENMTSHYGFVTFDRTATPGIDVIYVADDRSVASGGGIQRWDLSNGTWTLKGRLYMGLVTGGARGLTGYRSATDVTLIATTDESPPRVVKFVDNGTALDQITATELVAGAANRVFRGIALAPK